MVLGRARGCEQRRSSHSTDLKCQPHPRRLTNNVPPDEALHVAQPSGERPHAGRRAFCFVRGVGNPAGRAKTPGTRADNWMCLDDRLASQPDLRSS